MKGVYPRSVCTLCARYVQSDLILLQSSKADPYDPGAADRTKNSTIHYLSLGGVFNLRSA